MADLLAQEDELVTVVARGIGEFSARGWAASFAMPVDGYRQAIRTHDEGGSWEAIDALLEGRLDGVQGTRPARSAYRHPRCHGPLRSSNFRKDVLNPAMKAAGIAPGLRVHDLSHTAASLMVSTGASIKAVQRALGHASASITLDRYSHLYDDDLEALAEATDLRFGEQSSLGFGGLRGAPGA